MPSTLSYSMDDLKAEVGYYLGYGMGTAKGEGAWDSFQENRISFYVKEGLNQFYYPPAGPDGQVHSWSFLMPTMTLSLDSGTLKADLPEDFYGFEGDITITVSGESTFEVIRLTGESNVRKQHAANPDTTGRPLVMAVRPKADVQNGQRYELYWWPTTDSAYTLQGQYYIAPEYLTEQSPWVYGGPAHASTVLASCLAAAEIHGDDDMRGQTTKFMERMRTSIGIDRRAKAQFIGYNRDGSDNTRMGMSHRLRYGFPTILVNGTEYQ